MAAPEISQRRLYEWLTGDEDSRMCRDIPDEACDEQPRSFFLHLVASLGNKLADELFQRPAGAALADGGDRRTAVDGGAAGADPRGRLPEVE